MKLTRDDETVCLTSLSSAPVLKLKASCTMARLRTYW